MNRRRMFIWVSLAGVLILAGVIAVPSFRSSRQPVRPAVSTPPGGPAQAAKSGIQRPASLRLAATAVPAPDPVLPRPVESDTARMLRGEEHAFKVAREDIERYVSENRRSALSLLAAFRASGDTAYLNEAASSFPNDPRVQLAMIMGGATGPEKRKWLDAFRQSAPDNSLACYLSAHDHFQNGRFEEAIDDLMEASRRPQFDHYALQGMLDAQDLLLAAGKTPAEAKVMSMLSASFPHLAKMRDLSSKMVDLQSRYQGMGDAQSFGSMSQIGLTLAGRMNGPEGGKFIIDHLVGIAIENQFLKAYDPSAQPQFLGKSVKERLDELTQQQVDMKKLAPLASAYLPTASDAELISYFDRVKLEGELASLRWLQSKRGAQ